MAGWDILDENCASRKRPLPHEPQMAFGHMLLSGRVRAFAFAGRLSPDHPGLGALSQRNYPVNRPLRDCGLIRLAHAPTSQTGRSDVSNLCGLRLSGEYQACGRSRGDQWHSARLVVSRAKAGFSAGHYLVGAIFSGVDRLANENAPAIRRVVLIRESTLNVRPMLKLPHG